MQSNQALAVRERTGLQGSMDLRLLRHKHGEWFIRSDARKDSNSEAPAKNTPAAVECTCELGIMGTVLA